MGRKHQAEISDTSIHPLGDFFCTSSLDKSWAVHDISTGRLVRHVQDLAAGFRTMKFHPDGLILAGGQEGNVVSVWDIKDQVTVASLSGHTGEVTSLSFSNNGYYLASASKDGSVKLWDLRKPLCIQTSQVQLWELRSPATPRTSLQFRWIALSVSTPWDRELCMLRLNEEVGTLYLN